jgi:hypothetical protein
MCLFMGLPPSDGRRNSVCTGVRLGPFSFRGGRKLSDERFDQVSTSLLQGRGVPEIRCVSLHEHGIEVVLTDQQSRKRSWPLLEPFA